MKVKILARTFVPLTLMLLMGFTLLVSQGRAKSVSQLDTDILNKSSLAIVNIVKRAKPAVVHIKAISTTKRSPIVPNREELFKHPFFEHFFGPQFKEKRVPRPKQGSGFIISNDGYILTNSHVVEGADSIEVMLSDNREFTAKIVGTDPQTDVALVKIEDPRNLPVIPLGDSSKLQVGEWVIAIGNPFGLNQTVTVGVVSAKGRSSLNINEYENFIQTDAAINPGNSGGPLINGRGEVVGINTALFSRTGGYMGIGFAIPVNMAKSIQEQLKTGKVTRGWLGVVIQNVNQNLAESFGLKDTNGILISDVQDNSPASAAGLKSKDVIIELNNSKVENVDELRNQIAMIKPGTKTLLTIVRNGREKKVQVTIGKQPDNFSKTGDFNSTSSLLGAYGITVQELNSELAKKFNYEHLSGLIITDIEAGSPADRANLKPGNLIEEINQTKVATLQQLSKIIKNTPEESKILMKVRVGKYNSYFLVIPPK